MSEPTPDGLGRASLLARLDRLDALRRELVLKHNTVVVPAAARTAAAIEAFLAEFDRGVDDAIAAHPDLAELNVALEGFYGDTGA